ncbi:iridoid oxidase-like [Syzygium oleosum]|uniref:iridoid oxidase-like n=1 Tax=Syzygium oleosum TaxID=219896 RepID=UPI0011D24BAC|nr:iridoid oxidase-like [Syzygium oleosum]XP_056162351.1 iridoid oxidase-like [Syzygium oleosum]
MEYCPTSLLWLGLLLTALLVFLLSRRKRTNLPPQPPAWPMIGNILNLGTMPHQNLHSFQAEHGPVTWLKLGSVNTMVIQSAQAAAEFFKGHDLTFADRKCPHALTALEYDQGSLAVGCYGGYWRALRRLCSAELLMNKRVNETAHLRQKCVDSMIMHIEEEMAVKQVTAEQGINLSHILFLLSFNVVGNLVLSRDLLDPKSKDGPEFFNATNRFMEWAGKPNVADFLPWLKWWDPQRIKASMAKDMGRAMKIIEGFVKERLEERKLGGKIRATNDFLDALLDYEGDGKEGPRKFSLQNVNIIVLEMFMAGSETTSNTMEWALAELLRQPESMKRAKDELDQVVGLNRKLEESDTEKMPFLQAVVKETLRLHPSLPLLIPRNARKETNFMGYDIPKDTQVFVNAWSIGRDPDAWEEPLAFKPERFLGSNIDFKGQNFELIPFGSGRRMCVGLALAHRVLHLGLATLLHCFDWELGGGLTPATLDMRERAGLSVRKLHPLKVLLKKRSV